MNKRLIFNNKVRTRKKWLRISDWLAKVSHWIDNRCGYCTVYRKEDCTECPMYINKVCSSNKDIKNRLVDKIGLLVWEARVLALEIANQIKADIDEDERLETLRKRVQETAMAGKKA